MILPVVVALVMLSVPLLGGDLRRMSTLRFRGAGLAVFALLGQIAVINVFYESLSLGMAAVLHVATYIPAGMVAVLNRRLPGLPLIALGGGANMAAIGANGGVMPASPSALASAGFTSPEAGFVNSGAVPDAHLAFLGDIWAIPASWPLSNVFSIGDVLLVIGVALLMHRTCRPPRAGADAAVADQADDHVAEHEVASPTAAPPAVG